MNFTPIRRHEQMIPANLCEGHQIWHTLKIIGCEIGITSRPDLCQGFVDLYAEFLLAISVFSQLPKPKSQLKNR